ncbi:MAG TPA: hypothetical protein VFI22_18335 [Thermomicrobiales bacterium]|nr:hypothetical protein [Thermomicrobiales bacterium]
METWVEYVSLYEETDHAITQALNERTRAVTERFHGRHVQLRDVRLSGAGIPSDIGPGTAIWSAVLIFDIAPVA